MHLLYFASIFDASTENENISWKELKIKSGLICIADGQRI